MKVAVFSTRDYDKEILLSISAGMKNSPPQFTFIPLALTTETAYLAKNCDAVCGFVHDQFSSEVLELLAKQGTKVIAMRCSGK